MKLSLIEIEPRTFWSKGYFATPRKKLKAEGRKKELLTFNQIIIVKYQYESHLPIKIMIYDGDLSKSNQNEKTRYYTQKRKAVLQII